MSMEPSTRGSFSSFGYNKQELIRASWKQVGGTSHGVDPCGLGRWSWVRIRGKHDQYTRFVSGYRPCHNARGTGSVWSQHVRYYRGEGIQDPHPRNLFIEEITTTIQAWMQEGNHVVLGLDANEDVRFGTVQKDLANIGMFEAIIHHYPTKSVSATCNKNLSRMPIEGT